MMIRSRWRAAAVAAWTVLAACDRGGTSALPPAVVEVESDAGPAGSRLSVREREFMFAEILRSYRGSSPGCLTGNTWLSHDRRMHHTEGRLFARAYPGLAERLALEILRDPESPDADRSYAWFILAILAPRTNPALEQFLVEKASAVISDRSGVDESSAALSCLADRRFDERTLRLCRLQARRGSDVAIDLLSQTVDPESITLLKELATWSDELPYPIGSIPREAEEALKRISILQADDWEARLQRVLLKATRQNSSDRDTHWAIAAAKRRGMASFKPTIEKRLNEARARGEPTRHSVSYPEDFDADLILVTYAEAGGTLLPEESEYLSEHGFVGSAEERLLRAMTPGSRAGRR